MNKQIKNKIIRGEKIVKYLRYLYRAEGGRVTINPKILYRSLGDYATTVYVILSTYVI